MTALLRSQVESANDPQSPFPLNNLPYGVFSRSGGPRRLCVAIGASLLDVALVADRLPADAAIFQDPRGWNGLMEAGPATWAAVREALTGLLSEGGPDLGDALVPIEGCALHMPFTLAEFTDFYSGRHHATNTGTMLRGPQNALPPNWLHMPIGYNGRASSVVVSGTPVRRPWGQVKSADEMVPRLAPSARFDFELEFGAIVGQPSDGPLSLDAAHAMIFGYVLVNDWSARDIQAWEYQPLGPFQAKATATTISPFIVTAAALQPFLTEAPAREVPLLPHLADTGPMHHDIDLQVTLAPAGGGAQEIARVSTAELYYSAAQQLAHHSACGCPMRVGDLLGSGTISGPTRGSRGSMLELSWGGKEPLTLKDGTVRRFLEDGDSVTFTGAGRAQGYTIGFGPCAGTVEPAIEQPFGS